MIELLTRMHDLKKQARAQRRLLNAVKADTKKNTVKVGLSRLRSAYSIQYAVSME